MLAEIITMTETIIASLKMHISSGILFVITCIFIVISGNKSNGNELIRMNLSHCAILYKTGMCPPFCNVVYVNLPYIFVVQNYVQILHYPDYLDGKMNVGNIILTNEAPSMVSGKFT